MAVIYYPKSQFMYRKDTISASYETLVLAVNPSTILYFDTGSNLNAISASEVAMTASWAVSASWAPGGSSVSASYATSASWAPGSGTSTSASWASQSLSSSITTTALTASYVYIPSGSGAWKMYVDSSGSLVFNQIFFIYIYQ